MRAHLRPVGWWVRVYTTGLDRSARERRREEVESDIWEQARSLESDGRTASAIAAQIWARWLSGVPDDVLWRLEQAPARTGDAETEGRHGMGGSGARLAFVVPLGVVIAAIAAALALIVIGNIQHMEQSERFVASATITTLSLTLFFGGLASVVVGFVVMRTRPTLGAVLAAGGAAVAGLMTYWLIVPVILAGLVALYAVRRARRLTTGSGG